MLMLWAWFLSIRFCAQSWHVYDDTLLGMRPKKSCEKYASSTNPHNFSLDYATEGSLRLWSGLSSHRDLESGQLMFGFREAMDAIWKSQNPKNCSTAKYIISSPFSGGFGAVIHVEGSVLSLAMKLKRVYIQHPQNWHSQKWVVDNNHCKGQGKRNLECYYEPWSKCTLEDALGGESLATLELRRVSTGHDHQRLYREIKEHRVVVVAGGEPDFHIPKAFKPILECAPLTPKYQTYWWRAVSAAFLLRPNRLTLEALHKHDTLPIGRPQKHEVKQTDNIEASKGVTIGAADVANEAPRKCIAIYVRHGDKGAEMELLPFSRYAEAAEMMWRRGYLDHQSFAPLGRSATSNSGYLRTPVPVLPPGSLSISSHPHNGQCSGTGTTLSKGACTRSSQPSPVKPLIFLGTEDPLVIEEALEWGRDEGWEIYFTNIVNRSALSARLARDESEFFHPEVAVHHRLEYLSMILNLHYSVLCDAWVCTLASNWCVGMPSQRKLCRLIDELRATVGNKANRPYADIGPNSCGAGICINSGPLEMQW